MANLPVMLYALLFAIFCTARCSSESIHVTRTVSQEDYDRLSVKQAPLVPSVAPPVKAGAAPFTPSGIIHHGGPVMESGHKIYIVWYGTWSETEKATIRLFINSLGPQNDPVPYSVRGWWNINSLYFGAVTGNYINPSISIGGEVSDSSMSQGSTITQTGVINSFNNQILAGNLPVDYNGIYLVLTDATVKVLFC